MESTIIETKNLGQLTPDKLGNLGLHAGDTVSLSKSEWVDGVFVGRNPVDITNTFGVEHIKKQFISLKDRNGGKINDLSRVGISFKPLEDGEFLIENFTDTEKVVYVGGERMSVPPIKNGESGAIIIKADEFTFVAGSQHALSVSRNVGSSEVKMKLYETDIKTAQVENEALGNVKIQKKGGLIGSAEGGRATVELTKDGGFLLNTNGKEVVVSDSIRKNEKVIGTVAVWIDSIITIEGTNYKVVGKEDGKPKLQRI